MEIGGFIKPMQDSGKRMVHAFMNPNTDHGNSRRVERREFILPALEGGSLPMSLDREIEEFIRVVTCRHYDKFSEFVDRWMRHR